MLFWPGKVVAWSIIDLTVLASHFLKDLIESSIWVLLAGGVDAGILFTATTSIASPAAKKIMTVIPSIPNRLSIVIWVEY